MRALIDTNILLDLLLDRPPFADGAEAIWEACRDSRFDGYVSAISLINVFYIVRKAHGIQPRLFSSRLPQATSGCL
jgi:predicted nucleic acid-binding protein